MPKRGLKEDRIQIEQEVQKRRRRRRRCSKRRKSQCWQMR